MRKEAYKTPTTQVYPLQVEGYMLGSSVKCVDAYHAMHIALM